MKASDYIVDFLFAQGVRDVFGYPGGMVTHLMDSLSRASDKITVHTPSNEQGAAFAACGYAQVTGRPSVVFATSGPGATNLVTGICDAYFDGIPVVFITGQVNSFELKGNLGVRQRGFQETDIISMVSHVTKMAVQVTDGQDLQDVLAEAFAAAQEGRKGPVLLDITMDAFRAEVDFPSVSFVEDRLVVPERISQAFQAEVFELIEGAQRPCFLLGNGISQAGVRTEIHAIVAALGIPVVTTMLAVDLFPKDSNPSSYGFVGAYGDRVANFIIAKSDLVICLGARLDVRQTGGKRENFAPEATILRVDVDAGELEYPVRSDEHQHCLDLRHAIEVLSSVTAKIDSSRWGSWISVCDKISASLCKVDSSNENETVARLSKKIERGAVVVTDVGQNQVWVAQSFAVRAGQRILFSGGHGAMGYSLPAAIGACIATGKDVFSFNGDGGLQMNIQELQWIAREHLPVKIIVLDNKALGMIRHFQEMYFESRNPQTTNAGGYTAPDFCAVAGAYGLKTTRLGSLRAIDSFEFEEGVPELVEVTMQRDTYVFPKLEFGKPNQDQEPLLDRTLFESLMRL